METIVAKYYIYRPVTSVDVESTLIASKRALGDKRQNLTVENLEKYVAYWNKIYSQ